MSIRKGKSRTNYEPKRAYDEKDRSNFGDEEKFKQPKSGNVIFPKPIKQKNYNSDTDVDSTAIKSVEYNPGNHKLIISFQQNNTLNPKEYVYHEVPVEVAQEFMDSPFPRKQKLPEKSKSLGATFRKVIRDAGFQFSKRWTKDNSKPKK